MGMMQVPDDVVADVRQRLRCAHGQVQAVERMLGEGREFREVLRQLSAPTKALEQAAFMLVASAFTYSREHPEQAAEDGYHVDEVRRMFMELS